MNDDTIRMARKSKLDIYSLGCPHDQFIEKVKAFEALVRADERKSRSHSLAPGEMELSLRREHKGELFEIRHRFTAEQVYHGSDYMVEDVARMMNDMMGQRIAAVIRARGNK